MGLFGKIIEKREQIHVKIEPDIPQPPEIIDAEGLLSAMRDTDTVTVENALKVPCFASCVSLLSSIVAMLPIKLYREGDGETKEVKASEDVRVKFLNDESGDTLDAFQIKAAVVWDYLVYGNGYIYIDWQRNNIKGLRYVDSRNVSYRMNSDPIFRSASYMVGGKTYPLYHFVSLLRQTKNGVSGTGVFEDGKEALAIAYNTKVFQHYNCYPQYYKRYSGCGIRK